MTASPPTAELERRWERLRRLWVRERLPRLAAAALAADLAYEALNWASYAWFGVGLYLPLLAVPAFGVLVWSARRRSRGWAAARELDRRFGLKGRLEAFLRYRADPRVPAEVREAQAAEAVAAVGWGRVEAALRPRWPVWGWAVAGLYAALLVVRLVWMPAVPWIPGVGPRVVVVPEHGAPEGGPPLETRRTPDQPEAVAERPAGRDGANPERRDEGAGDARDAEGDEAGG
ncbi:MAG: hypothetical protein D6708_02410, partial [Candidatus Dadabacteria bacterium]